MHSLVTVVCQSWVIYTWNMEIAGQNVLFWRRSIKRLDLQITYRYRAETFRVYSYRLGLPSCVVTRSDLMRVSHSWTSKLKIPEILKTFWPASEPCREATSKYSDSIFPVSVLRTRTYLPCNWEGIGMHSLVTVVCQSWVIYTWNMEIAGQNVLFWRRSIERLDLQITYRYRAETFRVYSYRLGLSSCVVTRSDLMRVSHSWTSKLKIPETLKTFWPASEPCREATSKYSDSIFPVSVLRTRTYLPCNWEGIGMHSLVTVICQSWVIYTWNMEIAGQNVLFWRRSIKRLDLQITYRYRAETFRVYSYRLGLPSCVVTRSDLMRVSHSWTSKLKIPEILKTFWPASEPCREATSKYSDSIFPVRVLRTRTHRPCNWEGIGMHSLVTVVCQSLVIYTWNMEIAGQNVLFWRRSIKRLDLQITYRYRAETFRVYSYRLGLPSCVVTRSALMRVSHSWTSKLKIPEILKTYWPASEPCREATSKYSDSIFPVRVLRTRTYRPC